jgi:hypothetical protein
MANWINVDPSKIRLVFECPECKGISIVDPYFFQNAGTPICATDQNHFPSDDCLSYNCEGSDMELFRVEIDDELYPWK